jgi:hypothetical protein|tara:strand:- start:94 stop:1755 length:1662 start_codon:yes stop_codon:yes gene_type:complete
MKSLRLLIALFIPLLTAAPAKAEPPGGQSRVTLTPSGEQLIAAWSLDKPVDSVSLSRWVAADERDRLWHLDDDGWVFDGAVLSREDGEPFNKFRMSISESDRFYDRRYVPAIRIGTSGWAVLPEAFNVADHPVLISFEGGEESDVLLAGAGLVPRGEAIPADVGGFFYFGPPEHVVDGAATVIAGPDVPDWLRDKFVADTQSISRTLTQRFEEAPPAPPTLIVTYRDQAGSGFKGSSLGRFITLHVRGYSLDPENENFMQRMTGLALHETVHVWNGQLYSSRENSEQSWLHEGAAEYISLRAWMDPDQLRGRMEEMINGCQRALLRRPLTSTAYGSWGRTPYDCGALVQLIAEAASMQAGNGDILAIWKNVFERAGEGHVFDTAMFRAAASEAGGEMYTSRFARLEAGMNADDWESFLKGLADIGIDIEVRASDAPPQSDHRLAQLALAAVQRDYCNDQVSLHGLEDHYWIDISDRCGGHIPGNPRLRTLNGIDLIEAPGEAYGEIRRACAAGETVTLGRLDGEELKPLSCGRWMSGLTSPVAVTALPEFPEF